MNSEILICKMSQKSIQIGHIWGGEVDIEPCHIAAALAYSYTCPMSGKKYRLSRAAYDYAMSVILANQQSSRMLRTRVLSVVTQAAKNQNWKITWSKRQPEKLSEFITTEILYPKTSYCRRCSGSGSTIDSHRITSTCERCGGSGRRRVTDQELADCLGVSQQAVNQTWRSRYGDIYQTVKLWESDALSHIYRQFN